MILASLEALVSALNAAGVQYLVAGGLAVGAHGYPRLTMDIDLVVELGVDNIVAAFHALAGLGYKPLVSVTAEAFSDKAQRERWIEEKDMQVLNFSAISISPRRSTCSLPNPSTSTRNTTTPSRAISRADLACVSFRSRR